MEPNEATKLQIRDMLHGAGWKHVMTQVLAQVRVLDDYAGNENLGEHQRLSAVSRRTAHLWLVRKIYHMADEASPFDEQYGALLGMLRPQPREASGNDIPEATEKPLTYRQRSGGGEIA